MKKVFLMTLLTLAIFVCSQAQNSTFASDVWAAKNESGYDVYVVTETIKHMRGGPLDVQIKIVRPNNTWYNQWLSFTHDEGDYWYSVKGQRGSKRAYDDPVGTGVLNVVRQYVNF